LSRTIRAPSIFGKLFLLVWVVYDRHVAWHHTFILHQEANLENQKKLKTRFQFEVLSRESYQLQAFVVSSSGIKVLSFHPLPISSNYEVDKLLLLVQTEISSSTLNFQRSLLLDCFSHEDVLILTGKISKLSTTFV
jgi:hypothetical protein